MLKQVAEGVLIHESDFCQSNAVVVQGKTGVLLIDPGIKASEMAHLAGDLKQLNQPVVAGFSTHPHWDHLLWHPDFGEAPRYGTARALAEIEDFLADPNWKTNIGPLLPADIAGEIPLDLFGLITALPAGAKQVPWDGPEALITEHEAHAAGHAALMISDSKVLVAGDMLSDVLVPILDFESGDPIGTYLAGLQTLEDMAGGVEVFIPGHGSTGDAEEMRARVRQDKAFIEALREGDASHDPRIASPRPGWEWVVDVYQHQLQQLHN